MPAISRTVLINIRSDESAALRGVLWEMRDGWLVLKSAHALRANVEPAPVDGDVLIHRDNVAFIQVLP